MKQFILNLLAKSCSFGVSSLIAFFMTPFLVAHLGKDVYGFYPLANNFVGYVGIFIVAINALGTRYISLSSMEGEAKKANIYFSSIFFANVAFVIVLICPLILFVCFLEDFLQLPANNIGNIKWLFALLFVSMFVNMLGTVFSCGVFAKKRIDFHSLVEIVQSGGKIFFYLLLFWLFPPEIYIVGIVALMVAIIFFMMHWYFSRRLLPEIKISFHYFRISAVIEVFCAGFWNTVNQLGSLLLFTISLLLANVILGTAALGSLSIVQTIPFFINSFISAIVVVFYPEMMERYAKKNIPGLISQICFAQKLIGMTSCVLIAIFIVLGTEFFQLWLPEENASELQILSILTILRLTIVACVWPLSYLNTIMNKLKIPALTLIGSGILNCIVTIVVLKTTDWGIYAIPVCLALVSTLWFAFFLPLYAGHIIGVKATIFYIPMLRILPIFCILVFCGYAICSVVKIDSWIMFILFSFLLLIVFGVISIFGTFGIKDTMQLSRQFLALIQKRYKKMFGCVSGN